MQFGYSIMSRVTLLLSDDNLLVRDAYGENTRVYTLPQVIIRKCLSMAVCVTTVDLDCMIKTWCHRRTPSPPRRSPHRNAYRSPEVVAGPSRNQRLNIVDIIV
uniref:Uncharacterized protein n=1 Tax=Sipha flava TaxID=143950 RepID=A0A2S2PY37_9HEMI